MAKILQFHAGGDGIIAVCLSGSGEQHTSTAAVQCWRNHCSGPVKWQHLAGSTDSGWAAASGHAEEPHSSCAR